MNRPAEPIVVGWREYVELPEWGVARIKAKVDTGARSSAIDVGHIEELTGDRVRFEIVPDRKSEAGRRVVEAAIVRRTRVRSSFGHAHDRLFVEAAVKLAGQTLRVELGLVSRENMLCRMLLGRKSVEHLFLVDPGRTYLHGRRRRRSALQGKARKSKEKS